MFVWYVIVLKIAEHVLTCATWARRFDRKLVPQLSIALFVEALSHHTPSSATFFSTNLLPPPRTQVLLRKKHLQARHTKSERGCLGDI
jgi:hypothetical protein